MILKKNDNKKIKLTGIEVWSEKNSRIYYYVKEQYISQSIYENGETTAKKLSNNQKNIHLEKDGIVVNYTNKKIFDVTKSKPYNITITNIDDKPAQFEARVVDRWSRIGNRKVKLRVDWEPTSGSNGNGVFQVQSGSGKSGYSLNESIDVNSISSKTDILDWVNKTKKIKNLYKSVQSEIVERIWKGYRNYYGN